MCHFVSWVEYQGENYYIDNDCLETKEGRELVEYCEASADLMGHGAIRKYFGLQIKGIDKEITDFTSIKYIPKEIVDKIKRGKFSSIYQELSILTPKALEKYGEVEAPALEKYLEVEAPARKKYLEVKAPASEKYLEVEASAYHSLVKVKSNRIKEWR